MLFLISRVTALKHSILFMYFSLCDNTANGRIPHGFDVISLYEDDVSKQSTADTSSKHGATSPLVSLLVSTTPKNIS